MNNAEVQTDPVEEVVLSKQHLHQIECVLGFLLGKVSELEKLVEELKSQV